MIDIEDFLNGLQLTVSEVRPTADDLRVWEDFYPGGEIEVSVTLPFAQWAVVLAAITAGAFSVPNPGLGKLALDAVTGQLDDALEREMGE